MNTSQQALELEKQRLLKELRAQVKGWRVTRWLCLLTPAYLPALAYYVMGAQVHTIAVLSIFVAGYALDNWRNARNALLLDLLEGSDVSRGEMMQGKADKEVTPTQP